MSNTFLLFASLLYVVLATPIDPEERIVGGLPVSANDYPWMVSLRAHMYYNGNTYNLGPWCGASLISLSPPTILTAAHCVDEETFVTDDDGQSYIDYYEYGLLPIDLKADINRTDAHDDVDGDSFQTLSWTASQMTIHPEWNSSVIARGYDIAMIVIDDGQSISTLSEDDLPRIPQNDLSEDEACCVEDEHLEAIGYGLNHTNGSHTDTLEHTSLHFVDVDECAQIVMGDYFVERYGSMDNRVVCAIGDKTDTCQGDSGGPMFRMITDDDGTEVPEIVGITSWGIGCAKRDHPAVYTSISHFRDWINDILGWTSSPTQSPVITPAPTIASNVIVIKGATGDARNVSSDTGLIILVVILMIGWI